MKKPGTASGEEEVVAADDTGTAVIRKPAATVAQAATASAAPKVAATDAPGETVHTGQTVLIKRKGAPKKATNANKTATTAQVFFIKQ